LPTGISSVNLSLFKGDIKMTLAKYNSTSLSKFLDDLDRSSIGLYDWLDRVTYLDTQSNYPPYNLIKESDTKFRLELAVAGFKRSELSVYTENNQLVIHGTQADKEEHNYVHRSLSQRNFKRVWSLSDDVRVDNVDLVDGILTVHLDRIIPEHQKKKVYF
jgi:molecular chaperone IbpA